MFWPTIKPDIYSGLHWVPRIDTTRTPLVRVIRGIKLSLAWIELEDVQFHVVEKGRVSLPCHRMYIRIKKKPVGKKLVRGLDIRGVELGCKLMLSKGSWNDVKVMKTTSRDANICKCKLQWIYLTNLCLECKYNYNYNYDYIYHVYWHLYCLSLLCSWALHLH